MTCLWAQWIAIYLVTTAAPDQVSFDGTYVNRFGGSVSDFDRADKLVAYAAAAAVAATMAYLISSRARPTASVL